MHELSVCHALIDQVRSVAREHGAARIIAIHLDIGPLSGIEPDLLRRAYPLAAAGTIAEHSQLVIESSEVRVRCSQCGAETQARLNRLLCGECGDWRTSLISGDEMTLRSVELETTAPRPAASMPD